MTSAPPFVAPGGWLTFVASGKIIMTRAENVLARKDSLLAEIIDKGHASCTQDANGQINMDYDGEILGIIVHYHRTGRLIRRGHSLEEIREEARYWRLPTLVALCENQLSRQCRRIEAMTESSAVQPEPQRNNVMPPHPTGSSSSGTEDEDTWSCKWENAGHNRTEQQKNSALPPQQTSANNAAPQPQQQQQSTHIATEQPKKTALQQSCSSTAPQTKHQSMNSAALQPQHQSIVDTAVSPQQTTPVVATELQKNTAMQQSGSNAAPQQQQSTGSSVLQQIMCQAKTLRPKPPQPQQHESVGSSVAPQKNSALQTNDDANNELAATDSSDKAVQQQQRNAAKEVQQSKQDIAAGKTPPAEDAAASSNTAASQQRAAALSDLVCVFVEDGGLAAQHDGYEYRSQSIISTSDTSIVVWQCRWAAIGCPAKAKSKIETRELPLSAEHNHAPGERPSPPQHTVTAAAAQPQLQSRAAATTASSSRDIQKSAQQAITAPPVASVQLTAVDPDRAVSQRNEQRDVGDGGEWNSDGVYSPGARSNAASINGSGSFTVLRQTEALQPQEDTAAPVSNGFADAQPNRNETRIDPDQTGTRNPQSFGTPRGRGGGFSSRPWTGLPALRGAAAAQRARGALPLPWSQQQPRRVPIEPCAPTRTEQQEEW